MKKRFTLMMMVLCFLMSIPLKMMAETVTIHYIIDNGWTNVYAYVYEKNKSGDATIGTGWPGTQCLDNNITTVGGKRVATWTINLGDNISASEACVVFNDGGNNQHPAQGVKWTVKNNGYYDQNGDTTDPSEGGGSTGGGSGSEGGGSTGGGSTTEKWNTEKTNRLEGRVYTQGFYLAGNFFTFDEDKINYDDAVFKFQQQGNDDEGNAVYMVEIPASLTAHAQVMSVDEFGKPQKVYGPVNSTVTGFGISCTCGSCRF